MSACTGSYLMVIDGIDMIARVEAIDVHSPGLALWSAAHSCSVQIPSNKHGS